MTGRPPLPVGAHGQIRVYRRAAAWLAITNARDADGVTRRVSRMGPTKASAERTLKAALHERSGPGTAEPSADTRVHLIAEQWLAEVRRVRAVTTFDTYRRTLHGRVLPAFGQLRLRECTVPRVHRWLRSLEAELGPNTVRSCRTVLSGVLAFAVQQGALSTSPVREAGRIEGGGKRARALTGPEREQFLTALDADPRAIADGLPDLVRFMLGTGVRIGEALGLRWWRVDLDAGEFVAGPVLVRHTGAGLVLHDGGKTAAALRVVPLPDFVAMMLQLRCPPDVDPLAPVFPNTVGGWRDPNNTQRSFRRARTAAGFGWVTTHVLRKTAITILDEQHLTARQIAGHVGHARPSITMDTYMDLRSAGKGASAALDAAMRPIRGDGR